MKKEMTVDQLKLQNAQLQQDLIELKAKYLILEQEKDHFEKLSIAQAKIIAELQGKDKPVRIS